MEETTTITKQELSRRISSSLGVGLGLGVIATGFASVMHEKNDRNFGYVAVAVGVALIASSLFISRLKKPDITQ